MDFSLYQLPSNWKIRPLKEVCQFSQKPRGLKLEGDIPFFPMEVIPEEGIYAQTSIYKKSNKLGSGTFVNRGDVVVAKITPSFENGKQAIIDITEPYAYATTEVIPFNEIEGVSHKLFLFYVLKHPRIRAYLAGQMEGSTGRQRLSKDVLGKYNFPVPSVSEQKIIAGVLSLVQNAIRQQEKAIALTTELKKALMQKLFTEGTRQEAQKQTEIGLIPESWEVVKLEKVAESFQYGTSVKCDYEIEGKPVLRIPNVVGGYVDTSDLKYGKPKKNEIDTHKLINGDLLFVRTNGTKENAGRCSLYRGELGNDCYFASYLIRVRVDKDELFPAFVNEYTRTAIGTSLLSGQAIRTADGKFNINAGTLQRMLVPKPDIDQQEKIANIAAYLDAKVDNFFLRKEKLKDLFQTLLHQLMTAKIRVSDLNLDSLNLDLEEKD